MRYRVCALAIACLVVVFCTGASLAADRPPERLERYHQHEQAQQLGDLPAHDQAAARSTATEAERFATHMPLISIDTGAQPIPGEVVHDETGATVYEDGIAVVTHAEDGAESIPVSVQVRCAEEGEPQVVQLTDPPVLEAQAEMRVRGHSSREFDKKGYQLRFTEDDRVTGVDVDVLGMGKGSNWVLHGPFLDKTLLRNYVAMNIFGEIMPFTPEVRLCELFVDGQYQGVYLLMESIRRGDDRVDIRKSDPKSAPTSFIVKRDWLSEDSGTAFDFLTDIMETSSPLDIVYPSEESITPEQRHWIERTFNAFEKALYSYDYDNGGYGYWNYVDVDSFVDYFLVNELALNGDAGVYSTYFYQDLGGKLSIGPLWDFNNAFNNYMERDLSENGFLMIDRPFYFMMTKDERFTGQVIERWRELRAGILSDQHLKDYISAAAEYLGPAIERNYAKWGYSFDCEAMPANQKLSPDERNPSDYWEAVDPFEDTLLARAAWMDRNIENLKQYSHESAVKKYNH